jgi:UDP-3-O-[3-hydroxymyristoyl] N-acetylglucosamine deacetylase/3-hydroxyacyl-[acyl-carrier-protein] dehydratase
VIVLRSQQSISVPVEISGRGVHSGEIVRLRLKPAGAGAGIRFRRLDLPETPEVSVTLDSVEHGDLLRRTTLVSGAARVHTVEHVVAAAYALGVDNLIIEMDGSEPPALDGSSSPYVELINHAGIAELGQQVRELQVSRPIIFRQGNAEIVALPSESFRVTYFFTSEHPLLQSQSASVLVTPANFAKLVAPARTFCFFEEIEPLMAQGLIRGGSLASAVVFGRKAMLNESLRFVDEPVRHKILDFIGDLALLGRPVKGHFLAWRSGHQVNAAFGLVLRKEFGL